MLEERIKGFMLILAVIGTLYGLGVMLFGDMETSSVGDDSGFLR